MKTMMPSSSTRQGVRPRPKASCSLSGICLLGLPIPLPSTSSPPQDRSLCLLPLYHLNALTATLLPMLLSGGSVVMPHRFSVSQVWQWVEEYQCTWFAAVPTILTHLVNWTDPADAGLADRFRQLRFIRCSSAPLASSLHRTFEGKFPFLLVEAMGMTEAGELFLTPPSRARQKIGSPGLPCHETKIVNEDGHSLPGGQTGEILIRSPRIMKGYYKNAEATAAVLSPDGWLRTGDLGYQDADGYVFIAGRAKEIVIKGGENIAAREIDDVLMRHAAVLEAGAVGIPDSYLGEDLVAYVVLKPGYQCSAQELLTHCAQLLGEFKTPSQIYFVQDLPKGPSGKMQRLKLRERSPAATAVQPPPIAQHPQLNLIDQQQSGYVAPRTSVEEKLVTIWVTVLQRAPIGVHDNFFTLGGHSLLAAGILARVRDTFRVSLPLRVLFEAPTVLPRSQSRLRPLVSSTTARLCLLSRRFHSTGQSPSLLPNNVYGFSSNSIRGRPSITSLPLASLSGRSISPLWNRAWLRLFTARQAYGQPFPSSLGNRFSRSLHPYRSL
ncbi:MAG: AMP-binding protein [Deltaproteobacteria bacterium]|nr:AMP-binding protein [Deltaproteobacteria bacterium]